MAEASRAAPDSAAKPYLGVSASVSGKFWQPRLDAAAERTALHWAQKLALPEALARVLAARFAPNGAEAALAAEIADFLAPSLKAQMPDPYCLHNMEQTAQRLAQACLKGEKIAIFADYDVDGACSAALLQRFLAALNIECRIYIPDRETEGYGPNAAALRQLALEGAKLIITADCGANAGAALKAGHEAGADILVLDHHRPAGGKTGEFTDYIQVNPNQAADSSGLGYLCAAGVVYMCLVATARLLRRENAALAAKLPDLLALLDLTALATICDIVPLTGLNRAFVRQGLRVARRQSNLGLSALARAARLSEPLNAYHCSYILGSRINAGGRIGAAALGAQLLTATDNAQAEQLAAQLDSLNFSRQEIEAEQLAEALGQAESNALAAPDEPLVFAHGNWHIGIAGLLAARLRERFEKPAFVMALTAGGSQATGSARSDEASGADLGALIRRAEAEGLLLKGGGHKAAAGFTLKAENIPPLRAWLTAELQAAAGEGKLKQPSLRVDAGLTARGASLELIELLEQAGPYGAGNPQPVFAFPNHKIAYAQKMGKSGAHLRLTLEDGQGGRLSAVAFRAADTELGQFLLSAQGKSAHILGTLSANHWNGQTNPQLHILDAAAVKPLYK